jgi:cysteine desulfurase/selenocysteine lyase
MLNVNEIKKDFPIFANHPGLVYLDSAATTLKPASVIARCQEYYEQYSANVARGLYPLSEKATEKYEMTREKTSRFVNAVRPEEIVFTRGTTESINLVAYSLEEHIQPGDEILVTVTEHHSNLLPWQALAERRQATLKTLGIDAEGRLKEEELDTLVSSSTRIFALGFVSNVLGTVNPVKRLIEKAKGLNPNMVVLIDAAQAAPHFRIDVQDLGCDFLAFSAHKMFGPTGVGILWGRYDLLDAMRPFQYGGEMVQEARLDGESVFKLPPHKFEAGTPNIAGVIGFRAAMEYIESIGFEAIRAHESELIAYAMERLKETFGEDVTVLGPANPEERSGVVAFSIKGVHPHDIAHMLGEQGVCIRAGQHCAHPLHEAVRIPATARMSFSIYNSKEDVDKLIGELQKIQGVLAKS